MGRPLIGITCDVRDGRFAVKRGYATLVARLGGDPVLIPPLPDVAAILAARVDGMILSGGDDADTTEFMRDVAGKISRRARRRIRP